MKKRLVGLLLTALGSVASATSQIDKVIVDAFPLNGEYDATCIGTSVDPNYPQHKAGTAYPCKAIIKITSSISEVTQGNLKTPVPILGVEVGIWGQGSSSNGTIYYTDGKDELAQIYHAFGGDNVNYVGGHVMLSRDAQSSGEFLVQSSAYGHNNIKSLQINVDSIGGSREGATGLPVESLSLSRGTDGFVYFSVRSNPTNQYAFGRVKLEK